MTGISTDTAIDRLRKLGYEVEAAMFADNDEQPTQFSVRGFGIEVYAIDGEADSWQGLLDGHDERVRQQDESQAQTLLRWHDDPDNPYTLDDETVARLRAQTG